MITVVCALCGEDFNITLDEFLQDDEFLCPECAKQAYDFIVDYGPNLN